jgi:hypothetical protein
VLYVHQATWHHHSTMRRGSRDVLLLAASDEQAAPGTHAGLQIDCNASREGQRAAWTLPTTAATATASSNRCSLAAMLTQQATCDSPVKINT